MSIHNKQKTLTANSEKQTYTVAIRYLMLNIKSTYLLFLILFPGFLIAQVNTTSFGFLVKPIFPSSYFRTGAQTQEVADTLGNNYSFRLAQSSGFSVGAVVRRGLTKNLSFETGIQYVKRNYNLDITDDSSAFTGRSDFTIVGYEIPLQLLVFVQLSRAIWMNASLGTSLDIFPSNIYTRGTYFKQFAVRTSSLTVFNAGVIANIGWEYRTEKSGIIYVGSSYHRSFKNTYISNIEYYRNIKSNYKTRTDFSLKGDYLTLDLRYYFRADINKKNKNKN